MYYYHLCPMIDLLIRNICTLLGLFVREILIAFFCFTSMEESLVLYSMMHIKNQATIAYLRQMLTCFQNSFTSSLVSNFTVKRSSETSPHLKPVATLPWEILVFRNWTDWKHSNGRPSVHALKIMSVELVLIVSRRDLVLRGTTDFAPR